MDEINKIRNIALQEQDYLEKSWEAYNEYPDIIYEKEAGAGYDNVTKYAKEMDAIEVYNTPKQGYPWCKVFVDWCFIQALGFDRADELLRIWTAGVEPFYDYFSNIGRISNTPKIGDLVIFGDCDHIGIVVDLDDNKIYTVEGNTSAGAGLDANGGAVVQKEYSRWSSYIKCYARPEYETSPEPPTPPTPSGDEQIRKIQEWCNSYGLDIVVDGYDGPQTRMAITKVYQIELNEQFGAGLEIDGIFGLLTYNATPIVQYGAEGNITKAIQSMLYCKGYDTNGVDGIYGDATFDSIRTFQANHGLEIDGIYGQNTGYALFN